MDKIKTEWDLSKLGYKGIEDPKIKVDYHLYEKKVNEFEQKWNKGVEPILADPMALFQAENEYWRTDLFWSYMGLLSALNINDNKISKVQGELGFMASKLAEKMLFVSTLYKEIGKDKLMEWSEDPKFAEFKNSLRQSAESVEYILSEREQNIMNKLSEAYGDDIFEQYQGALKFGDKTLEEVWSMRSSPNRENRMNAFKLLSDEFNQEKNRVLFDNIYSVVCKSTRMGADIMGWSKDVMFTRNRSESMDSEVVEKLLSKIEASYPIYHEYLKTKARLMGLDKLKWYDVGAPMSSSEENTYDYEKGLQIYLDAIKAVDSELYEHGVEMADGRIDVYPKPGKSGGAFCSYDKDKGEWVLLNWTGKAHDITTLAHELGHAFHGRMAKAQNYVNYNAPLVLAETASIFNETVLFNELIKTASGKNEMICNRLDDLFATIFRQVMYVAFEKECHESWMEGKPLSWEDYNDIWFKNIEKLYGDSVELDKEQMQWGWMAIPHIYHTPFYCYAYSFGNILSLNVYKGYEDADDKAAYMAKYKSFLALGGSLRPKDAISQVFGLDITEDKFYDMSFEYIKELINQLK